MRRRQAHKHRRAVVQIAANQEGLLTLDQVDRSLGRRATTQLAAMEENGEIVPLDAGVWVHAAVGRDPLGDQRIATQAAWLLSAVCIIVNGHRAQKKVSRSREHADHWGEGSIGSLLGRSAVLGICSPHRPW